MTMKAQSAADAHQHATAPVSAEALDDLTRALNREFADTPTLDLLDAMVNRIFPGRIAQVSSFGTEAALLLALVAEVNPATPIIFIDTLKHFPETLEYRDKLISLLGLTDVRDVKPDPAELNAVDPAGTLWQTDPDKCCFIRKVKPLSLGLNPNHFTAWINGRKRIHGGDRARLDTVEHDGTFIKINAMAGWTQEMIDAEWQRRGLPEHPMVPWGYTSVGCNTPVCTAKPPPGEGGRSGRWAGFNKRECGIHIVGKAAEDYDAGL